MMWTMTVDIERAPYAGWRALAATVLVMSGSLGAHTWAGGHLPDGAGLVALSAVVFAASMLAMRGAVPTRLLLVGLAAAQAALHTSFTTLGHAEHAAHSGDVAAAWTWQMLAAHTAVTVLSAAVWWLCSRAATVVIAVLTLVTAYVGGRRDPRAAARDTTPAIRLVHLSAAPRRGPPVLACCG